MNKAKVGWTRYIPIRSVVEESDIAYKRVFSRMEQRPWGYLFVNEENPLHYDANHAHLSQAVSDQSEAEHIVAEVVDFFDPKGIFPRVYLYQPAKQQALLDELEKQGFKTESLPSPIQLWQGQLAETKPRADIEIEPVTTGNYEDCLLVESVPELGGREIREKAFAQEFAHPAFQHFLLRVNGEPASTLCLLLAGPIIRVENVATLPAFRGQGLIGHLIRHAQEQFLLSGGTQLLVCPINEQVEKVYSRYGFVTMDKIHFQHAYRGGKGILELR